MELQCIFTPQYVNFLENNIDVNNYYGEKFPYDAAQIKRLNGIEKPKDLESKMLAAQSRFEEAVLLYEAFENLSPMFAATRVLWTYLTHVDLFNYVKKRWPEYQYVQKKGQNVSPKSAEKSKKYISNHWFYSQGIMRTTLMGLWWSVYLTVKKEDGKANDYTLTRVFFSNDGLRTRRLGTGYLGRNRQALQGILSFINDHKDLFGLDQDLNPILNNDRDSDSASGLENRMIWITRHFNLIGGTKPLGCLSEKFFYNELNKYKKHLKNIKKREDVVGSKCFV